MARCLFLSLSLVSAKHLESFAALRTLPSRARSVLRAVSFWCSLSAILALSFKQQSLPSNTLRWLFIWSLVSVRPPEPTSIASASRASLSRAACPCDQSMNSTSWNRDPSSACQTSPQTGRLPGPPAARILRSPHHPSLAAAEPGSIDTSAERGTGQSIPADHLLCHSLSSLMVTGGGEDLTGLSTRSHCQTPPRCQQHGGRDHLCCQRTSVCLPQAIQFDPSALRWKDRAAMVRQSSTGMRSRAVISGVVIGRRTPSAPSLKNCQPR